MILPTFYLSFLGLLSNVVNVPKTDSMSTLLLTVTSISFQGPGFPEDTGNLWLPSTRSGCHYLGMCSLHTSTLGIIDNDYIGYMNDRISGIRTVKERKEL